MDAIDTLQKRGFFQQCTHLDQVRNALSESPLSFYVGFDPTASSLHAGSLVQIMAISWLQRFGHRPVIIVGGGTSRIGDPSGKTELRKMMTSETIANNIAGLKAQLSHFIDFGPNKGILVNNNDWLGKLNYIDFLRDIGRHFSVNRMLAAEAYKQRLETGLSFIELNYQILQAYDFLELFRTEKVMLQVGGSDQWGNIVAGVDLVRRMEQTEVWGLTTPLLTTASGAKMGKTANGAVWLDPNRLSAFDYWQFWYNVDDRDVGKFLRLFTFLDLEECERLEALPGKDIREAKRVLANEATKLLHGAAAAEAAERGASAMTSASAEANLPTVAISGEKGLLATLVAAKMAKSNGEARRLVNGGGVRIDGEKVADPNLTLTPQRIGDGIVIRVGKKRSFRLVNES